jgi:hypothetical protein
LVTVVVPAGNANPLGGTLVKFVIAQLSVAVARNVTGLVHAPGSKVTVMFDGQVISGG